MEMSNEGKDKSAFKLTSIGVLTAASITLSESSWALHTPSLEMAHHKLHFSTN